MREGIKTPHGEIAARSVLTHHMMWLTYNYNRKDNQVGLQSIFTAVYGKKMQMIEVSSDTVFSFDIKKAELDEYMTNKLQQRVAEGSFESWYLPQFMTDLANKDVLPAGTYVVTVSW